MARKVRTYSRATRSALELLGKQIKLARKSRRIAETDFAARVGMARSTLQRIEKGDPLVEIGLVFEAADIAGVTLFEAESSRLADHHERLDDKLKLLPKAIRQPKTKVSDDF